MLLVGVKYNNAYSLTIEEEKTHFALWAMVKSPLLIGADLRDIRNESLEILKNKELIAVNQDPMSEQAECFSIDKCTGPVGSYFTTMGNGAKVVAIINWSPNAIPEYQFRLRDIGMMVEKGHRAIIRDLYNPDYKSHINFDIYPFNVGKLESHHSRILKIEVVEK